jgi:hypothetical protein
MVLRSFLRDFGGFEWFVEMLNTCSVMGRSPLEYQRKEKEDKNSLESSYKSSSENLSEKFERESQFLLTLHNK